MAQLIWTKPRINDVLARLSAGESLPSIALSYEADPSALYRILSRRGLFAKRQITGWTRTLFLPRREAEIGYIAGLIDGEGSILMVRGRWWQVKIGMTHRPTIEWLAGFGGTFQTQRRSHVKNRKDCFTWHVARKADVAVLLHRVLPYLKTKHEVATRALESFIPGPR